MGLRSDTRYIYGRIKRFIRGKPKRKVIFAELRKPERDFDKEMRQDTFRLDPPIVVAGERIRTPVQQVVQPIGDLGTGIGASTFAVRMRFGSGLERGRYVLETVWF